MIIYIIIIFLLIAIYVICKLEKYEVKYVKSTVDGTEYLVRDESDKQDAADLLANINNNIHTLVTFMVNKNDEKNRQYVTQLSKGLQNVVISESNANSSYTSYSVNKGEQIVFCLRSKYTNNLHDINLLMYVAIHELAHVGCPEYGHTKLFKEIFAYFCKCAIEAGVYSKIEFGSWPREYCGLIISESII